VNRGGEGNDLFQLAGSGSCGELRRWVGVEHDGGGDENDLS
jgi:hypothetical protein